MQGYREVQITKDDIVPTALKMKHDGVFLAMIHAYIQTDGQVRVSYEYAQDPELVAYYVVGETVLPSVSDIYDTSASWPEREPNELLGLQFEGLDTSQRLFLPEDMPETEGRGQILVKPLSELCAARENMEKE